MIKKLVISLIVFLIICATWWGVSFILSYKSVEFTLHGDSYQLQIRNSANKKIKELDSSSTITLRAGDYIYNVVGNDYDSKSTPFTVEKKTTIEVFPEYTKEKRAQLAAKHKSDALKLITSSYPDVGTLTVKSFSVSADNQWGYGTIQINDDSTDIYRFILRHDGKAWHIHVTPRIIISKSDAKDVPDTVLYSLY